MDMHTRLPSEVMRSGRLIAGSIRNPWDWYVSMWGYGCDGKGALHDKLTGPVRLLGHGYRRSVRWGMVNLMNDLRRDRGFWRELYSDAGSPDLFRRWLKAILDSPRRREIGEGYSNSPLRWCIGLLTYRYCYLFHDSTKHLFDGSVTDTAALTAADRLHNLVICMIRTERLEEGIVEMLKRSGHNLPPSLAHEMGSMERTNPSSRKKDYRFYYDDVTAELVGRKDSLVVSRYGYSF
jgi:hypothetical protein